MDQTLNTFVVAASVTNASCPIKDLEEDIEVTLQHLIPNTVGEVVLSIYTACNESSFNE